MTEPLLKTKELCEQLSVTRQTIHKWRKDGLPVEFKRGRIIRYNYKDVIKWLEDRKPAKTLLHSDARRG